jgi:(p)ppGpp synthase/HD superfamily hydrolase
MPAILAHMNSIVDRAVDFARKAHESVGQTRKYTGEPYIVHPLAVMNILQRHSTCPPSDHMLAAAGLHDTVEDTPVTIEEIAAEFGSEVANLVWWLTNPSKPEDGNRKVRKALDRAHLSQAPISAKNIKLADLVHNAGDIVAGSPGFARVWLREMEQTLPELSNADPALWALANSTLEQAWAQLNGNQS